MSDAYSKYLNKNMSKKPSRKLISLEESMDSHNDEIMPNVFIDSGSVA